MTPKIVTLRNVTRRFGPVVAVNGVSAFLSSGECVGLVGHNGAGKSTLIHLITGSLVPSDGEVDYPGVSMDFGVKRGSVIRCVQQELSLCGNLTVAENMRILFPQLRGRGWRGRAAEAMACVLDEIFPGHRIDMSSLVETLPISQRQQVEIARAFAVLDTPPQLVILDEPTSSIDLRASEQLFSYVANFVASGRSVILVTHKMQEVFSATNRIIVMRDGTIVSEGATRNYSFNGLVDAMGHAVPANEDKKGLRICVDAGEVLLQTSDASGSEFTLRKGEIVGLAGLAGHGQSELIQKIFWQSGGGRARRGKPPGVALVSGDRQKDGLMPVWSIGRNISVGSLNNLLSGIVLDLARERRLSQAWADIMQIKCTGIDDPVMSLSGGGQQKALFARALASDADVILMDDPMRGVDIGTKRDVYRLIREETAKGRSFVWYTTEFEELLECDRAYVLRNHMIASEIRGDHLTENEVLKHSFAH